MTLAGTLGLMRARKSCADSVSLKTSLEVAAKSATSTAWRVSSLTMLAKITCVCSRLASTKPTTGRMTTNGSKLLSSKRARRERKRRFKSDLLRDKFISQVANGDDALWSRGISFDFFA